MSGQTGRKRRADLDALDHSSRVEGLTYRAIADRLGVDASMARRRVLRQADDARAGQIGITRAKSSPIIPLLPRVNHTVLWDVRFDAPEHWSRRITTY